MCDGLLVGSCLKVVSCNLASLELAHRCGLPAAVVTVQRVECCLAHHVYHPVMLVDLKAVGVTVYGLAVPSHEAIIFSAVEADVQNQLAFNFLELRVEQTKNKLPKEHNWCHVSIGFSFSLGRGT